MQNVKDRKIIKTDFKKYPINENEGIVMTVTNIVQHIKSKDNEYKNEIVILSCQKK